MQQEEQRILRSGRRILNEASEARVRQPMRVALHPPEQAILVAESQRLGLREQAGRRLGGREVGRAIDPLHAVGLPELQRVGRAELNGADGIRHPEKIQREDVGSRSVEAPIGQRDTGVDRLKFPFEIEKIGAVPGEEARRAMACGRLTETCMSRKSAKRPKP